MQIILAQPDTTLAGLAAQLAARLLDPSACALLAPTLDPAAAAFLAAYGAELPLATSAPVPVSTVLMVEPGPAWGTWAAASVDYAPAPLPTALIEQVLDAGIELSSSAATLLALGIYTATHNLLAASTRPADLRCVARLLEQGAMLSEVRHYRALPAISTLDAQALITGPLRALEPNTSFTTAATLFQRWPHGALPLLDSAGHLLGDIAETDVRKAISHGLGAQPVLRYAWQQPLQVAPDTPLPVLLRLLASESRGRAYVVDADMRVLGVLTRGDVLRATQRVATTNWLPQIEAQVAPALWQFVRQAVQWAAAQGWPVYVVGGFVRDIALQRPPGDLDLVVEGEAIACARALAEASGGSLRTHEAFGTATVSWPDGSALDFIQARTELYGAPAALPEVSAASLYFDLHRRDFTINTLAVTLGPPNPGQLYDFYNAERDLARGVIRVLHNLSFVDDPTRVLRAIRLATRLGFQIEPRTAALIHDAIAQGLLRHTTAVRIRQELERCFSEPDPVAALAALAEWGVLAALQPPLIWSEALAATLRSAIQQIEPSAQPLALALLLLAPLDAAAQLEFAQRYAWTARQRQLLEQFIQVQPLLPQLRPQITPGQLDLALAAFDPLVLKLAQVAADPPTQALIERYRNQLRPIRSIIAGRDLQQLGVPSGPRYGRIIAAARAAQLDGAFVTPEAARHWLEKFLAKGDQE